MARPQNLFANGAPNQKDAPPPYVHQEYPRVMHHASGAVRHVKSREAEDLAVEEGFSRQPQDAEVAAVAAPKAGECPNCIRLTMEMADLKVVFDKSWKARAEETAAAKELLEAQIEGLKAKNEALTKDMEKKKSRAAA